MFGSEHRKLVGNPASNVVVNFFWSWNDNQDFSKSCDQDFTDSSVSSLLLQWLIYGKYWSIDWCFNNKQILVIVAHCKFVMY